MDIQLRKLKVMKMFMKIRSENLVEQMKQLLVKSMIVAHTTDGKPLTLKAYNKRLEIAEKHYAEGKWLSQENAEKEAEQW